MTFFIITVRNDILSASKLQIENILILPSLPKTLLVSTFFKTVIWTKLVGFTLPDKDLLIGFDILHIMSRLQIMATRIKLKNMFLPYTDELRLYTLSDVQPPYYILKDKFVFCPESHSQFIHPSSLWKNNQFFIKLSFKLNEDINSTKATHPGMLLLISQEECA